MTYNGRFVERIGASSWDHCSLRKEASVCLPDGEGGGGRPIDPTNVTKLMGLYVRRMDNGICITVWSFFEVITVCSSLIMIPVVTLASKTFNGRSPQTFRSEFFKSVYTDGCFQHQLT